jgi:riboflavin biosynthesis pyrimidine reductase
MASPHVLDAGRSLQPLQLLYEPDGLPTFDLPTELVELYGGSLGFDGPTLYANFVSTVDGVVTMPSVPRSNQLISADSDADRFVVALLRACADAVVIGSGTLAGSPRSLWTAERAWPDGASSFAELRSKLGGAAQPELVVLTGGGAIDVTHPALEAGALILSTASGASRLRGRLPDAAELVAIGNGFEVDPALAIGAIRERGHELILSEAGPRLFGSLLAQRLVDELFLTVSPLLAGRSLKGGQLALVEGVDLVPGPPTVNRLVGVRHHGSHVFLRYDLTGCETCSSMQARSSW